MCDINEVSRQSTTGRTTLIKKRLIRRVEPHSTSRRHTITSDFNEEIRQDNRKRLTIYKLHKKRLGTQKSNAFLFTAHQNQEQFTEWERNRWTQRERTLKDMGDKVSYTTSERMSHSDIYKKKKIKVQRT